MRTLAITQNVTLDGSIEMLGDWFDPQGQADVDQSDLLEELHRQDSAADGFLVGRQTFEDLRSYVDPNDWRVRGARGSNLLRTSSFDRGTRRCR